MILYDITCYNMIDDIHVDDRVVNDEVCRIVAYESTLDDDDDDSDDSDDNDDDRDDDDDDVSRFQ